FLPPPFWKEIIVFLRGSILNDDKGSIVFYDLHFLSFVLSAVYRDISFIASPLQGILILLQIMSLTHSIAHLIITNMMCSE
ncbi:MAG: hypothetical protein COY75_09225, partial [Nitrospirae bacterium CG_4_10_14_0_8_um_filter_41_23]